jgi:hypothetical protein
MALIKASYLEKLALLVKFIDVVDLRLGRGLTDQLRLMFGEL